MDPITAIGFAANILSFIDYSTKAISTTIEIYEPASGNTQDGQNSETIATEMRAFAAKLQPPDKSQLSGEEKALCNLATECQGLAKRILDLLEKFKPKNRKSRGSSLVAGLKTKFYEGERRKLEGQLNHCRAQLGLQLGFLTSSKTQARLDDLFASARDDSSKLQQLHNQVEHLRRGVAVGSLTPAAQAQLQLLLGMPEHVCEVIAQHRILESLAFKGMYGRYETVDCAHLETLRWIFKDKIGSHVGEDEDGYEDEGETDNTADAQEEDGNKPEDEAKTFARESLLNWMSSGTGIFHISGKLGSGKSTLMKYLCDHDRTQYFLEQWAGNRQLIFASFYFWKPGSTMQKSLTGLIRSLLHDVLKACPELMRDILPDYWARIKSTPWQIQARPPLTDKDIRDAFSRLISDPSLYTNHCFCFFIDGLGEYEGTHQEDPKTLVDLLSNWTKLAPTTIKICVSSREYNVFMNTFPEKQRIRLHKLTKSDITSYVLDKLRHLDRGEDRTVLAVGIVNNAQGIFVWVTLVVKRIRKQIENGANLDTLQRELDALPKELNTLFEHLLSSLVDYDLRAAYETISMVMDPNIYEVSYRGIPLSLPLLSYSFLDDFLQDPMFALRQDFQRRLFTPGARGLRIESARKRLNGCCRGLLETRQDPREPTSENIIISHRSISEFLSIPNKRARIERYLDGFNAIDAISQLTLAELWSRDAGDITISSNFDCLALALVPLRSKAKLDMAPYPFLKSLAMSWQRHQDQGNYDCVGNELVVAGIIHTDFLLTLVDLISSPGAAAPRYVYSGLRFLRHPIYVAAAYGIYDYVHWELERNPSAIPLFTPLRLVYCLLINRGLKAEHSLGDVIDILHTHHGICPETPSSLFGTLLHPAGSEPRGGSMPRWVALGDQNTNVSLWHHILLRFYRGERDGIRKSFKGKNKLIRLGFIVENLLEYGADPYFHILIPNSEKRLMKLVVRVQDKFREHWLVYPPDAISPAPYECEDMFLSDLVERWGFENKTRIHELIKKNTLMLEGVKQSKGTCLQDKETPTLESSTSLGIAFLENQGDIKDLPAGSTSNNTEAIIDSVLIVDEMVEFLEPRSQNLFSFRVTISIGILVLGTITALLIQWTFG